MTQSDHAVFKRLSRQQLVVRRRSVGFQVLIFETTVEPLRCRRCGRHFSATWKAYLCHICGLWTCEPCSSVIERERDMYRIRFVRACASCMALVNKWPDPALLTNFADATTQWVVQSSKCQLALNLADALRTSKRQFHAVLALLKHLSPRAVATIDELVQHLSTDGTRHSDQLFQSVEILLDASSIGSEEDVAQQQVQQLSKCEHLEQLLVQQCFEVAVPELALHDCVFAEDNGARAYPICYDAETETPRAAPVVATESARAECLAHYNLTERDVNTDDMALLCDLAAKELDALSAFISVIEDDHQRSVACRPDSAVGVCGVLTQRAQTFCAFALATPDRRPFLVRDAVLDFRFRNLLAVSGDANVRFYFGFPILSHTGVHIASLCIVDSSPRKQITTMQYSIVKRLAETVAAIWTERCGRVI